MGFFQGVMQQLNLMDERKAEDRRLEEARDFQRSVTQEQRDFQVSQAEADRAFQREVADRRLTEERKAMLIQMIPQLTPEQIERLGVQGISLSGTPAPAPVSRVSPVAPGLDEESGTTPSPEALGAARGLMERYGVSAEAVAPFAGLSRSHVEEVASAVDAARDIYIAKDRLNEFTPEIAEDVMKDIRIIVEQGREVNVEDLARMVGADDLSEQDVAIMNILATRPDTVRVISDYQPRLPISPQDLKVAQDNFLVALQSDLEMKIADLTDRQSNGERVENELLAASQDLEYITENKTASAGIIARHGGDTFRLLVESEPALMNGSGLSGPLGMARRAYEQSLEQPTPEAGVSYTFNTTEELNQAIESGLVKAGDRVSVNGQTGTVGR